jgi:hypothetical protein
VETTPRHFEPTGKLKPCHGYITLSGPRISASYQQGWEKIDFPGICTFFS